LLDYSWLYIRLFGKPHFINLAQTKEPMPEFELVNQEYIELNKLLKVMNLVGSGGEAHQMIDAGEVRVNNQVETQRRKKLRKGDVVLFFKKTIAIK
jgi:ribosome-associated protein